LSHRSKEFESVLSNCEAKLRSLLDLPENYKVLWMQGGASLQFAAVVYNLLGQDPSLPVDYVVTGAWSEKAAVCNIYTPSLILPFSY
jgi:phosphoserine aminotransferase